MAVFSEREGRRVHYRDFFAFGTISFLEPDLTILEMIDDYEKSPNIRWVIVLNLYDLDNILDELYDLDNVLDEL